MATHQMKRNDTEPPLETDVGPASVLATGILTAAGNTVDCIMRKATSLTGDLVPDFTVPAKVNRPAAVIDEGTALRYVWQTSGADTNESGRFAVEWEVKNAGGVILRTFPTVGYDEVIITDDLDDDGAA